MSSERIREEERRDHISTSVEDKVINAKLFWTMTAIGWLVMGYGIFGLFENANETSPSSWIAWFAGAVLVHDFVVVPLVVAIGVLVLRRLSQPWRAAVQGALIATGIMAIWTFPFVLALGTPEHPSQLPLNYGLGLLIATAIVWVASALILVGAWQRK